MRESSAAPRCQLGLRWELPRCRLHQRYGHRRHDVTTSRPYPTECPRPRAERRERIPRLHSRPLGGYSRVVPGTRWTLWPKNVPACGRTTARLAVVGQGRPRLWAVVTTLRELVGVDAARREGLARRTPRKALCWPSAPWGRPGRRGEPLGGRGALPGAAGTFPDETQTMAARRRVCPVPPIHSVQLKRLIVCPVNFTTPFERMRRLEP